MSAFASQLFDLEVGFCRHRPLFGWAMALVFGTGLGYFFGGVWGWLLMATAALYFAWRPRTVSVSVVLWCCCFALAGWRAAVLHDRNAVVLSQLHAYRASGEMIDLKVTVSNDCRLVKRKRGGPYCQFSVDDAWLPDGTEVHGANLLIRFYDRNGVFPKTGEVWRLQAKLYANSRIQRPILSARGETARHLVEEDRHSDAQYLLSAFRESLEKHLSLGVSAEDALLTQTMVLGARARLPKDAHRRYADAGIVHIFAISGLHVGIIVGMVTWFLAWFGVRLRLRIFVLLPILVIYLLITGVPPSAARACLMAVIYCLAPTLYRRSDGASALFATAVIVLLIEPGWIANVGALLSFCVMGGLFLFTKPLSYFLSRFFHAHPQRTSLGEFPQEQSFGKRMLYRFSLMIALSLSAWLSVLPLSLYFFGRVSLVGVYLNLFVPLLTFVIVWCACFSALFGFFAPCVSVFLNRLNATILTFIDVVAENVLKIPGALYVSEYRPGVTVSLIFGFLLVVFGLWLNMKERQCRLRDPLDPENFRFLPESSLV